MKVYDKEAQQGKPHCNEFAPAFEYIMFSFFHVIFSVQQLKFPIFASNIKKNKRQTLLNTIEEMTFM